MLDGLLILLGFQFAGEILVHFTGLPIPGAVAGMLMLLVALATGQPGTQRVADTANLLIGNLTLLFFPIGVGIVMEWDRFSSYGLAVLVSVIGGTLIIMTLVALALKWLMRESR